MACSEYCEREYLFKASCLFLIFLVEFDISIEMSKQMELFIQFMVFVATNNGETASTSLS